MSRSSSSNNASKQKQTAQKANKKQNQGVVDQMKYEIAGEFGVNLGADASARENGQVGGEITKRLVQSGLNQISGSYNNNNQNF